MLIKTLLNKVEQFKSSGYGYICLMLVNDMEAMIIGIEPRSNSSRFGTGNQHLINLQFQN